MTAERQEIERFIPQRDPFLFLDEVCDFEPFKRARSLKRLIGTEPFFAGHFPDRPVFPGVLILENMAQTANFLLAKSNGWGIDDDSPRMVFGMVNRARFIKPVIPEAVLETEVTAVKLMARSGIVDAISWVDGEQVAVSKLQFGAME